MRRRDLIQGLMGTATALSVPSIAAAATAMTVVPKGGIVVPDSLRRAVLDSQRRPEADRKRDAARKPAETMAFYGIKPGMTVAELVTSRGYFTGVLAEAVGNGGKVYGQNNKWMRERIKDTQRPLGELITKGGYTNIIEHNAELEDLKFPAGQLDAVFIVMFYHDLFWLNVDRAAMNRGVLAGLKPGGIYGIIDHHASPGMGTLDVNKNHRIERAVVVDEGTKAGFALAEETDLLENLKDPMNVSVFQQELRGNTHQFVLKFKKPA
jgi:predicted methyltransferase